MTKLFGLFFDTSDDSTIIRHKFMHTLHKELSMLDSFDFPAIKTTDYVLDKKPSDETVKKGNVTDAIILQKKTKQVISH